MRQQSVTGPDWRIIGDSNGLFADQDTFSVIITGVDPQAELSNVLRIDASNQYIVYGEINSQGDFYGADYPVLASTGYDIIYPVDRGNSFRFFTPGSYLTFFDCNWSSR